jgi:23S rRNA (uracil1939-C5)-methyltransferase
MIRSHRSSSAPRKPAKPAPHRPESAQPLLVQIEKPIYGGAFLARVEGKAVFVPLALPGEQARVRIADEKRGYATAVIDEVISPAPQRIAPACPHFALCGGCNYQHASYATQLAFKRDILRETLERAGIHAPEQIHMLAAANEAQSWAYRNRIRLAFSAQGEPGYRARRSSAIVPIAECPIAAPLLVSAAQSFAHVLRAFRSSLRPVELSLFCNSDETALLASVFAINPNAKQFTEFALAAAERIPQLKGIELLAMPNASQRDRSPFPKSITQWGQTSLVYRAAGFDYRVDHGAFFQVNRWLVDELVARVTAGRKGNLAWDLFAGVGLFARKLTESFKAVVAVESAPPATAALAENLHGTTGSALRASTLEFLERNTNKPRANSPIPDFTVIDPPRTGLGLDAAELLANIGAPAIAYVSCDPATLARDLRMLLASGYAIEKLTVADLFPQTFHIETVVELARS